MSDLSTNLHRLIHEEKDYTPFPPFPEEISLEVFTGCNHTCVFCPNKKQTRIAPVMPLKKAERWLQEAYALGARKVGLYAKGEPFAVKSINEYIAAAKKIGFHYIYLTTNGSLLNRERLVSALEAGLSSLKFSINGLEKEEYSLIHGKDDFDTVISNLEIAIELREQYKFGLFVSIVKINLNSSSVDGFIRQFGNRLDEIIVYDCSNFCGYINNSHLGPAPPPKRSPCNLPFSKAHITPEGYLTACCGDYENYLAVADLNKMSMLEAWHSEIFVQLRKKHISGDLRGTICNACIHNASERPAPLDPDLANKVGDDDYWTLDTHGELLQTRHKTLRSCGTTENNADHNQNIHGEIAIK